MMADATPTAHASEIAAGRRFEFGSNWTRFLESLDDRRIAEAELSLRTMLDRERLDGLTFLDIGSGSGLFSLAARRLGARVTSFDFDPKSVACTRELQHRYFAGDPAWQVHEGSVLDGEFIQSLGRFDIVYSWGVLHHTGAMRQAIERAATAVADSGQLFIAIYNHQVYWTAFYTRLKRLYVSLPPTLRPLVSGPFIIGQVLKGRWPTCSGSGIRHAATGTRSRTVACRCGTTGLTGLAATPSRRPSRRRFLPCFVREASSSTA